MVSFSCTRCGDIIKKPKIVSHYAQCRYTTVCCVDCHETFEANSIELKGHRSCMTEYEKYQEKWKPPKNKSESKNVVFPTYSDSDDQSEDKAKTVDTKNTKSVNDLTQRAKKSREDMPNIDTKLFSKNDITLSEFRVDSKDNFVRTLNKWKQYLLSCDKSVDDKDLSCLLVTEVYTKKLSKQFYKILKSL